MRMRKDAEVVGRLFGGVRTYGQVNKAPNMNPFELYHDIHIIIDTLLSCN